MFQQMLESKRTRTALRFFTYGIMSVLTVVGSVIFLLLALGYRLDKDLSFEQGGLIQFRSQPSGAKVTLNGEEQNFETPNKTTIDAGIYDVTMSLEGYRTWTKTAQLEPGMLLWLNYTRFIPNNITTETLRSFETLANVSSSPDNRWLLLQPSLAQPNFVLADLRSTNNFRYSEFNIETGDFAITPNKNSRFNLLEWNPTSRFILISHINGKSSELLRVDRENPAQAFNLTQEFGTLTQPTFDTASPNNFLAIKDNRLVQINIDSQALTNVADNVSSFVRINNSAVAFKTTNDKKEVVVQAKDSERLVTVATFAPKTSVQLAAQQFFGDDYLALGHGKTILFYKNPTELTATNLEPFNKYTTTFNITKAIEFSNNGRFLLAQLENKYASVDIEAGQMFEASLADKPNGSQKAVRWLDDYHFITDVGGSVRIFDFDGTNEQVINSVQPGFDVFLNTNEQLLLSIGKNSANDQFELQQANLVVEN